VQYIRKVGITRKKSQRVKKKKLKKNPRINSAVYRSKIQNYGKISNRFQAGQKGNTSVLYWASIKSFPGYKHLLQENYVEYKHIFSTIT